MIISIEQLSLEELRTFLCEQAEDAFPDLKDEQRLNMLAEKWHKYAESCICRDENYQLVGIIVFYANRLEEKATFIPHVYVSTACRRQGLFTKMLHLVEDVSKSRGFSLIRLEVDNENYLAMKSYACNGFKTEKEASPHSSYMYKTI